ncbi:sensor histidine kinase [Spirosoma areae]
MKIKFNKYVEAAFLLIALLGIIGREWVIPGISWTVQLLLFMFSLLVFNAVWLFHYNFNEWLNRHLPFEANVTRRVTVQLLGGWLIVKSTLFVLGITLIDYVLPEISQSVNRLNIIALGMGAFFANMVLGLGFIASYFFNRWQENLIRASQLEKEKVQVQLDNLKNQINPHFLFNSLSSLDGLIHENPDLASHFLRQLSKVFRYVIQHKEKELVSLDTELSFIKNYVALLQTRFDGAFRVCYQLSDDALERQIVPVTLQILIENAIKHNSISEVRPLTITISSNDGYLAVSNPIQRRRQVETSNGQGLENLKLLYSYLGPRSVEVDENEAIFRVRVPLLTTECQNPG